MHRIKSGTDTQLGRANSWEEEVVLLVGEPAEAPEFAVLHCKLRYPFSAELLLEPPVTSTSLRQALVCALHDASEYRELVTKIPFII
jgi:hypothetical protein